MNRYLLARICIVCSIAKILLIQPFPLLVVLWNVNTLDFKDDRPCSIIAARDHHSVIISPTLHDRSTLKRGVDISADCIPCLPTELAIHQVVEIILLRRSFQKKSITFFEEWKQLEINSSVATDELDSNSLHSS